MALTQLVAHHLNCNYFISTYVDRLISTEISELFFNGNTTETQIQRTSDIITFKHLEIHTNDDNMTIEDFKLLILDGSLELFVYNSDMIDPANPTIPFNNRANQHEKYTLITYYFDLLTELEAVRKINNAFIIQIPFEQTIGELVLIAMQYQNIHARINFPNGHNVKSFKLFYQNIYLDTEERKFLASNLIKSSTHYFNLISKYDVASITDTINTINTANVMNKTLQINLSPKYLPKGYFIKGDISKIKNITFEKNNDDYNKKIISSNLLYVSNIADSNDFKCLKYSKNLTNNICYIEFFEPTEIRIYELSQNLLLYTTGFIGLKYPHKTFVNNKFMENIIQKIHCDFL